VLLAGLLPEGWRDAAQWGYPHQSELALIAGVFRAQTPQANVDELVDHVMHSRSHSLLDDLRDLANGGVEGVVKSLGPRWGDTNVLGVPVLRAVVIHGAATALVGAGVNSADDLREAAQTQPDAVRAAVLKVRGLGPATWEWITFLAHAPVPPDAAIVRFLGELLEDDKLKRGDAAELIRLTARRFASDERMLAHALRTHLDAQAS
jgi:hypothetical protein